MAMIGGEQGAAASNFLNYVLKVTRKDFVTGQLLTAAGFQYTKPFKFQAVEPELARRDVIKEGAAVGSEATSTLAGI